MAKRDHLIPFLKTPSGHVFLELEELCLFLKSWKVPDAAIDQLRLLPAEIELGAVTFKQKPKRFFKRGRRA